MADGKTKEMNGLGSPRKRLLFLLLLVLGFPTLAHAVKFDEMSLERWGLDV